jgi:hypothetical protein
MIRRKDAIEAGLCRSGLSGTAPRAETSGYWRRLEEGQRRWGGKPSSLGYEKRVGGDT